MCPTKVVTQCISFPGLLQEEEGKNQMCVCICVLFYLDSGMAQ